MNDIPPKIQPGGFWGKWNRKTGAWHPLIDHCADVAACTEAILSNTLLGKRLARAGGLALLNEIQIARLGFLAAIHDLGKVGRGFQLQCQPGVVSPGHVGNCLGLLHRMSSHRLTFRDLLPPELTGGRWISRRGAQPLLIATICHHGWPLTAKQPSTDKDWLPGEDSDPFGGMARLIATARQWFPRAFEEDEPLPESPEFQHAWNGILTLADWLGSDERFFPYSPNGEDPKRMDFARCQALEAIRDIGLEITEARDALKSRPTISFKQISRFQPRDAQSRIAELPIHPRGSITVLEASTGVGKTEAALWHFARLFRDGKVDGMYFALPTRTAATQIERRIHEARDLLFADLGADDRPQVVLAVPGYLRVDGVEGQRLPKFTVQWDDDRDSFSRRAWAGESSKRYLAGSLVVGTIDQVLLSALAVRHCHLRASCLLRQLLVVDEVHASDAYMTRILEEVLNHHEQAGGHALLMSATLGSEARRRLFDRSPKGPTYEQAIAEPYPALYHRAAGGPASPTIAIEPGKSREVEVRCRSIAADPQTIADLAIAAARKGARVLVVRNTVKDCRALQLAIEEAASGCKELLFGVDTDHGRIVTPHHGRYAVEDRRLLDEEIEKAFSPHRLQDLPGMVAVATQTVEQSLDLDADLLLSDLCPLDVLLQRIGRLHRHERTRPPGFETARVEVLVPAESDLCHLLQGDGRIRGNHGFGTVYGDLRILQATWNELRACQTLKLPDQSRELVESTTHPDRLSHLAGGLDKAWQKHQQSVFGELLAQRNHAGNNLADWSQAFGCFEFGDQKGSIMTRLGDNDIALSVADLDGPFGLPIKNLNLRGYEVSDLSLVPKDPQAGDPTLLADALGFTFRFLGREYRYDRLGLCALSAKPA